MDRLERIEARWFPGVTARQLAEELGVSRVTLFRWYRDDEALRVGYPLARKRRDYAGDNSVVARLFVEIDRSGMTLTELAERSGVHITLLSRWRAGKVRPSVENLKKVLDVLCG